MDCFKLNDDGRRKVVAEGLLDVSRVIREGHVDLDHASISCALALARINKQPVDVSELAKISGVPRATVIRKVKIWHEQGMVEIHRAKGRTYVVPSRLVQPMKIRCGCGVAMSAFSEMLPAICPNWTVNSCA